MSELNLEEQVAAYLRTALPDTSFDGAADGEAAAIDGLISIEDYAEAYERAFALVKQNDLSDVLFLTLAYTNLKLNYPDAAQRYATTAALLHRKLGGGNWSPMYDSFADEIYDLVQDTATSRMVVHERFINSYPTEKELERANAVDEYVMEGFKPSQPFITKEDQIVTVGSCFTGNVSTFLRHNGYNVPTLNTEYTGNLATGSFSDEVFNTYILRYLFELAFGPEQSGGDEYAVVNQHNRETTFSSALLREYFCQASVFIITLGIAEVWFNKNDGTVYQTAKSVGEYDPEMHDFRVTSVEENVENISAVRQMIRDCCGDVPVIFTLSPVPLKATFRPMSCVAANAVSKATLRLALDTLFSRQAEDENLHYFPSYELVQDVLPKPFGADRRYVTGDAVNFIMSLFANHYLVLGEERD